MFLYEANFLRLQVEGDEDGSSSDSDESNDEVKDEAADDEVFSVFYVFECYS